MEKDYEKAVREFEEADQLYREFEEMFLNGTLAVDLIGMGLKPDELRHKWTAMVDRLRNLLEDRNAKRKSAADALRQAVQLAPTQQRGPDGKSTVVTFGEFKVSSVTHRTFYPDDLIRLAQQHGVWEEFLTLTKVNKDGATVPLVKQEWVIDYEGVLNWLRAKKLEDIITVAYDEKEKTPQVKGPKDLAFLGDKKGD